MSENDTLGARIKTARKRKGLTLKELGQRLGGMSHANLSRIENGVNPGRTTLIALARELNDDFGLAELQQYITGTPPETDRFEVLSLKFASLKSKKSKMRAEVLIETLERELERMANEPED